MAVGNCNYLDHSLVFAVNDCEGEPLQYELPSAMFADRPAAR